MFFKLFTRLLFFALLWYGVFGFVSASPALASVTNGTISGYAWSDKIGWIHFGTTYGNTNITDTGITGYAWNENTGWINLNPAGSGVTNTGNGVLGGYAWAEGTGYINFNGVVVNSAGGFSGNATGDNGVTIYFGCTNCNVLTDWRPIGSRPSTGGGAGGGSASGGGSLSGSGNSGTGGFDTEPPVITITSIKNTYDSHEEVLITGTTEANAYITMIIDNRYGLFNADGQGNWFITLGKMSVGSHYVTFTPKDVAGNIGETVSADFWVVQSGQVQTPSKINVPPLFRLAPPLAPILRELEKTISDFLPNFFKPLAKISPKPIAVITVPRLAPLALGGRFNYISSKTLSMFALGPLPKDIKLLAQKFPKVQTTFDSVGIQKITDLQKLANTNLKLPGLTETVLSPVKITAGKLATLKGIAIEHLSISAKNKIPSEIMFAKTAGGLVDFNVALSLNSQGKTEQTISTIAGQPLQLVVKPDKPAKRVVGYMVFKSKKYNQTSFQVPLENVMASLLFSAPNFAAALAPSLKVNVEGSQSLPQTPGPAPDDSNAERRLVISYFEYQDTGDGVYVANIETPLVDAEYEIITVIEYLDELFAPKEIKLITLVDPEGYIYEKNGGQETRIAGAVVSLYWLNPDTKKYDLWPAQDFQQEDPQITDVRGTYSFLVPNGWYYLKVDAPGYLGYEGKPFEVKEGSGVHMNIELKTKYWFLKAFDWKTLLLILVILLLCYNFYKDRRREKQSVN